MAFDVSGIGVEVGTPLRLLAYVFVLRQAVRSLWVADLIAVVSFWMFIVQDIGSGIERAVLASVLLLVMGLAWIWVIRRFGFLALLFGLLSQYPLLAIPFKATGWMAERVIVLHLIPVAVALWALWVILSARQRPSTESAA